MLHIFEASFTFRYIQMVQIELFIMLLCVQCVNEGAGYECIHEW